jgi:glycosyltransferase involved in cell wall biosynthesis
MPPILSMASAAPMPLNVLFPFTGTWFGGSNECTMTLVDHFDPAAVAASFVLHDAGQAAEVLSRAGHGFALCEPLGEIDIAEEERIIAWFGERLGAAAAHIEASGADIVHVTECPASELWALAAAALDRPVVWHVHGPPSHLMGELPALAGTYICVSEFGRQALPPHLRAPAQILHNAFEPLVDIDRAAVQAELRTELGVSPETRIIGYCGRLSDRKRPDLFVEAAGRIAAEWEGPLAFVMLGDDRAGLARALEVQARMLGLAGCCFVVGYRPDAARLMAGMDILLVPALGETFGRVLVEAMAVGTGVVASDSGGHGEIIRNRDTGLLVAVEDAGALAAGALELLRDTALLEGVFRRAKGASAAYFDPQGAAKRMQGIYRDAVKNHRPAEIFSAALEIPLLRRSLAAAGGPLLAAARRSGLPLAKVMRLLPALAGRWLQR